MNGTVLLPEIGIPKYYFYNPEISGLLKVCVNFTILKLKIYVHIRDTEIMLCESRNFGI